MSEQHKGLGRKTAELAVATLFTSFMVWSQLLFLALFIYVPLLRVPMVLYVGFKVLDPAVENGRGRPFKKWIRTLGVWQYLASYFSCSVSIEEDIDPNSQYVYGYHPHGILSYGAQIFGCYSMELFNKMNGDHLYPVALPVALRLPIFGDYLMALGAVSCSKACIRRVLGNKKNSIAVVIGGAQESLHGEPGKPELILDKRKGFVREAIMAGAYLCPIYVFGETGIYRQVRCSPGSFLYKIECWVQWYFSFAAPLFYGRFLLVPFRAKLHFVRGKVVHVKHNPNPTRQEVEYYHELYKEELVRLYNKYRYKYEPYPHADLKFAE
ncbi:2-acylglycerol O-acyltransferase 1 [Spiromyces aspiralis]|uniref:2-acylglycerol O-acyltransferase 1 n=1 Tax=Spiromyces aspiralis TaxID=68401 RepID=A0ACC1HNZ7_9FUNG|nr:2-acylglycerol O-acyltransferase 1 [Spiromyces aspiralis]